MTCVCGVGESNETCCLPIIKGEAPAKTAEALMRARYAAYVLGEVDFILESVHPDSPGEPDRRTTEAWSKNADWQGLKSSPLKRAANKTTRAWLSSSPASIFKTRPNNTTSGRASSATTRSGST